MPDDYISTIRISFSRSYGGSATGTTRHRWINEERRPWMGIHVNPISSEEKINKTVRHETVHLQEQFAHSFTAPERIIKRGGNICRFTMLGGIPLFVGAAILGAGEVAQWIGGIGGVAGILTLAAAELNPAERRGRRAEKGDAVIVTAASRRKSPKSEVT